MGRQGCVRQGLAHHSFLLHEKHAFLVLAQVRPGSLELLLLLLRLRWLLLDVGHQGAFVGIGHGWCHSLTQVRIEMGQRLSVAIRENVVLFV